MQCITVESYGKYQCTTLILIQEYRHFNCWWREGQGGKGDCSHWDLTGTPRFLCWTGNIVQPNSRLSQLSVTYEVKENFIRWFKELIIFNWDTLKSFRYVFGKTPSRVLCVWRVCELWYINQTSINCSQRDCFIIRRKRNKKVKNTETYSNLAAGSGIIVEILRKC